MRQLKDINGKLRTCTRCNSGSPAVYKKCGEWLCQECLARRKARQARTAAMPKCHKCNGLALHGEVFCANHKPQINPITELQVRMAKLELNIQKCSHYRKNQQGDNNAKT